MSLHNRSKQFLGTFFFGLISLSALAQNKTAENSLNKGKMFVSWGWNRASYSNSDIHFKGENYDFTLYDVAAKDRVTPFSFDVYLNPATITIPQTNFSVGYYFHENYGISLGVDHMKYVMTPYQSVRISGDIAVGSDFDQSYNYDTQVLTHDFLQFEHTDGLNYVYLALHRIDDIGHWFGMNSDDFTLQLTESVAGGVLLPKTNARLFGGERYDDFHLSGWGMSASVGVQLSFLKYFFVQSDLKAGYINMPDIKTSKNEMNTASQRFTFLQKNIVFGVRFNVFNTVK